MRLGPEHPACMTPRDAELWWDADRIVWNMMGGAGRRRGRQSSPCDDCDCAFAEAMRAVDRCDGHYPGEGMVVSLRNLARRPYCREYSRRRRAEARA